MDIRALEAAYPTTHSALLHKLGTVAVCLGRHQIAHQVVKSVVVVLVPSSLPLPVLRLRCLIVLPCRLPRTRYVLLANAAQMDPL